MDEKKVAERSRRRRSNSETTPATTSPARGVNQLPRYIRLPTPKARCAWTGLSRGTLNDLILGPGAPAQSVVVRREGASRGVRLIELRSLLEHLEDLRRRQEPSAQGTGGKEVPNE